MNQENRIIALDRHYRQVWNQAKARAAALDGRPARALAKEAYGPNGERLYYEPTVTDVHVDGPLTNLSVMYKNESYIGDQLFPFFPVSKKSDVYFVYNHGDFFRDEVKPRATGSPARDTGYTVATSNYNCVTRALATVIPDEVMENADSPLQPRQDAVAFLTERFMISRELRIANLVCSITNVGSGINLTGTNQWSDLGNSDPVSVVTTGNAFTRLLTGRRPNTLIVGAEVHDILLMHPDIIERIKYTARADQATIRSAIADIFGVQNYLVADAVYNPQPAGATDSFANIWGKNAVLAYVNGSPGLRSITAGLTFAFISRQMRSGREDRNRLTWTEMEESTDERIIDRNCIYTITNAVA